MTTTLEVDVLKWGVDVLIFTLCQVVVHCIMDMCGSPCNTVRIYSLCQIVSGPQFWGKSIKVFA